MLGVDGGTKSYRMPPEERGYYELSIAIIRTAVADYRKQRRLYLANEKNRSAYSLMIGLRAFFLSDVFENISGLEDPYQFLHMLDKEIDEDFQAGTKRKRMKQMRIIK